MKCSVVIRSARGQIACETLDAPGTCAAIAQVMEMHREKLKGMPYAALSIHAEPLSWLGPMRAGKLETEEAAKAA